MPDYNKIFQTMAIILEHGEHVLRQTARKLEKQENPLIKISTDWQRDFPEFYDLLFKEAPKEDNQLEFLTVAYTDAFCKAIRVTSDNIKEALHWLENHQAVQDIRVSRDHEDNIIVLMWTCVAHGINAKCSVKSGDYIIESFDGWESDVYGKTSEDFNRNLIIIKE